jgi:mannose-1-phosphate guanylyltransferase / mannose-6-phosphate isomerase
MQNMTLSQHGNKGAQDVAMSSDAAMSARSTSSTQAVRIVPVILAGGTGSRLWPLSREQYPKQFIDVLGQETLLQSTVSRLDGFHSAFGDIDAPLLVCGAEHKFSTVEQLKTRADRPRIIVEPARRDTAPALTLAAVVVAMDGDDGIIVSMPADHVISDVYAFQRAIESAIRFANEGAIVTLGIPPTRAEIGFGYIQLGTALPDGAHNVADFVEKPDVDMAVQYLASKSYWWNSGIFVSRASVWLEAVRSIQPEIHEACVSACALGSVDGQFFEPASDSFTLSPSI